MSMTLCQQLEHFLDRDFDVSSEQPENVRQDEHPTNQFQSIELLRNITILKPVEQLDNENGNKYSRRFSEILKARQKSKVFSSHKEFSDKCKALALDPMDILSGKTAFPWPHPKNTRYVERYRKIETRNNGAILAAPIDSDHLPESIDSDHLPELNVLDTKREPLRIKSEPKKTKKEKNKEILNDLLKKRKQKRKRGPKKK